MEEIYMNSKLNPCVPEWTFSNLANGSDSGCDVQVAINTNCWESVARLSNPNVEWSQHGLDIHPDNRHIVQHSRSMETNFHPPPHTEFIERSVSYPNLQELLHTHQTASSDSMASNSSDDEEPSEEKELLADLADQGKRYLAIIDLCKKSDIIPDLAVSLWNEPGCMAILLLEVVKSYCDVYPPNLQESSINLICSIAALKQRIVLDPRTRQCFLESGIINFLLPFLGIVGKTRDLEHLRICVLSLLLTVCHKETTEMLCQFLRPIQTDVMRLIIFCLTESISEVGRSMALKILLCFLADDAVLSYLCQCFDRFRELLWGLGRLVVRMERKFISDFSENSKRVFKYTISCFMRICDDYTGREALLLCIPSELFDGRFYILFSGDPDIQNWLTQLYDKLYDDETAQDSSHSPDNVDKNNNSLSYNSVASNSSDNVIVHANNTSHGKSVSVNLVQPVLSNCFSDFENLPRSN